MMFMGSADKAIISAGYDLLWDAQSCRRLVSPSCRGRYGSVPVSVLPLMRGAYRGQLGQALVIMAGYDDSSIDAAVDQVIDEATAQGVSKVIWLTYPDDVEYRLPGGLPARTLYGKHNASLQAALVRHPTLQLLDWDGHSAGHPDWFASDGIHLSATGSRALTLAIKATLDALPIARCVEANAVTGANDPGTGTPVVADATPSGFVAVEPRRVLDTRRPETGGTGGKVGSGRTVTIDVSNLVPEDATSAVLSVTAVDPCGTGYLTTFACGARPTTSNVNYAAGRTTAGFAVSALTDRKLCLFASAATDVVVDVQGYFAPDGERLHPLTPTRWVDTRGNPAVTSVSGKRSSGTSIDVPMGGSAGVPGDATAVWLNVTAPEAEGDAVVSVHPGPCGETPSSSTVNVRPGRTASASTLVGLGPDGSVCVVQFAGSSHLIIDVFGWFGPGDGGLSFRAETPVRLLDTRGTARALADAVVPVPLAGTSLLNVIGVDPSTVGFASLKPCGAGATSSLLNLVADEDVANAAPVAPSAGGTACLTTSVAAHLVVDRSGSFVP